jgi:hypothetical protein
VVARGGGDDDEDSATEATLPPEQKIEQAGNERAALFAAYDPALGKPAS